MPKKVRDHQSWLIEKLADPARAASYLNTALEDSHQMFLEALRDVVQARKVAKVAKEAGVTRKSLYDATSAEGNPTFETFHSVLSATGLTFQIVPEHAAAAPEPPNSPSRSIGRNTERGPNFNLGTTISRSFTVNEQIGLDRSQLREEMNQVASSDVITEHESEPGMGGSFRTILFNLTVQAQAEK
ncbi:MAG: addiction module antidote protein [Candidatus Sulfotelmatobacter sp.]